MVKENKVKVRKPRWDEAKKETAAKLKEDGPCRRRFLDEATGEYMIHLEPGNGSQSEYTFTFEKEEGENLHIAFINYYSSDSSRTTSRTRRRPEVDIEAEEG